MFQRYSITTKLILSSVTAMVIVLSVGILVLTLKANSLTENLSIYAAHQEAEKEVANIKSTFEKAKAITLDVASTAESMLAMEQNNRDVHNKLMRDQLRKHPTLNAIWAIYLPNAFDGHDADFINKGGSSSPTGRYVPYYLRTSPTVIEEGKTEEDINTTDPITDDNVYFFLSYNSGKPAMVPPYVYESNGMDLITTSFTAPVYKNNKVIGVVGVDITTNELSAALAKIKPFGTGSVYLLGRNGIWLGHTRPDYLGKNIKDTQKDPVALQNYLDALESETPKSFISYDSDINGDMYRAVFPVKVSGLQTKTYLVINIPSASLDKEANAITYIVLGVGIALLLCTAFVLWIVSHHIVRKPIRATIGSIQSLIAGNYQDSIPYTNRQDEIGEINQALLVFKEASISRDKMAAAQKIADEKQLKRADAMQKLIKDFSTSIGVVMSSVADAVDDLNGAAQSLSSNAQQTSSQSTSVAVASEQASANVETVAAASEELFASVQEIGRQVENSSNISANAVNQATETNNKIQGLARSANRIGEVVKLINDIASQTNLLALNATIEAARAGEAGKGFAVVANEVKSLANQTAKATDEIIQHIQGVQTETTGAVDAIAIISRTIEDMNHISSSISAAVEEQGVATQEISRNVQEASQGTQDVSRNIAGVSTAAHATGDAAEKVFNLAQHFGQQARNLQHNVDTFLTGIHKLD
jgi:methyl-accepting chemotaxis protein